MKRNEWSFEYTASQLAAAAEKKKNHHLQRENWWKSQKEETVKRISETGIQVHDSVAAQYSTAKSSGFGPQVVIDPTMERDLQECQQKIAVHNTLASEYEGWRQVLIVNAETPLSLDHSDFLFFFGE